MLKPALKTDSLIAENNTITMRDRKINFRPLTLLDQGIFLITFDQFMNAPLLWKYFKWYWLKVFTLLKQCLIQVVNRQ